MRTGINTPPPPQSDQSPQNGKGQPEEKQKSRIKELLENCIEGGAPTKTGRLSSRTLSQGCTKIGIHGVESAASLHPWGLVPSSEDCTHRHVHTQARTLTQVHTNSAFLPFSLRLTDWNRPVLLAGLKGSPFGFSDSRSLQVLSGSK